MKIHSMTYDCELEKEEGLIQRVLLETYPCAEPNYTHQIWECPRCGNVVDVTLSAEDTDAQ